MSCVWMLQRGHSGDGCVLASTLCKYNLRKGDLFVLSYAYFFHSLGQIKSDRTFHSVLVLTIIIFNPCCLATTKSSSIIIY